MTDIKLDDDLSVVKGDLELVTGAHAAAQRVRHRLLTFRGEWFLDLEFGPDYRDQILKKGVRLDVVSAILKAETLKSVDGTFSDFEAETDNMTRSLSVSYTIDTAEGEVSGEVTIT